MDLNSFDAGLRVLLSQPHLRNLQDGSLWIPTAFGDGWVDLMPVGPHEPRRAWRITRLDGFEIAKPVTSEADASGRHETDSG